jgi:hypothetical protein
MKDSMTNGLNKVAIVTWAIILAIGASVGYLIVKILLWAISLL